ncbi:MAG: hypothetical protein ACREF4_12300 [Gammaproteobacteria bacterium]
MSDVPQLKPTVYIATVPELRGGPPRPIDAVTQPLASLGRRSTLLPFDELVASHDPAPEPDEMRRP